jgi:hypothetical protein
MDKEKVTHPSMKVTTGGVDASLLKVFPREGHSARFTHYAQTWS